MNSDWFIVLFDFSFFFFMISQMYLFKSDCARIILSLPYLLTKKIDVYLGHRDSLGIVEHICI